MICYNKRGKNTGSIGGISPDVKDVKESEEFVK